VHDRSSPSPQCGCARMPSRPLSPPLAFSLILCLCCWREIR
jgi:hypothetical protein